MKLEDSFEILFRVQSFFSLFTAIFTTNSRIISICVKEVFSFSHKRLKVLPIYKCDGECGKQGPCQAHNLESEKVQILPPSFQIMEFG